MAENYYSILTSIGKAQIANALGLGTKVDFVKMKVGDGNGSYYNPTENQTDLVHTVWEGAIGHVAIDEDNPNWINIEVLIPPDVGGFMIREYAVFDANNNMLAIAKCAETYKPLPADGSTKEINMKMVLAISNTSTITLKIDPTIMFAKKKDVDEVSTRVDQLSISINNINTQLSESVNILAPITGSTANAILLNIPTLTNNKKYSFKANANSTGNVTINGKLFKKLDGTQIGSGGVKVNKVYDFYYDSATDSVFILAKAEGDATDANVLAGKIYSNGDDVGRVGTMPNNGAVTITPSTTNQAISLGYHNGNGYVLGDSDLVGGNIKSGINLFGINGTYEPLKLIPGTSYNLYNSTGITGGRSLSYILGLSATNSNYGGTVTVSFDLGGNLSNQSATIQYGRIYVNGVARGTERTRNGSGYVTYTEDITINVGDVIQIYFHGDRNDNVYEANVWVQNLKIACGNNYGKFS